MDEIVSLCSRLEGLEEHEISRVQPLIQEALNVLNSQDAKVRVYEIWSEFAVMSLLPRWWDSLIPDARKVLESSIVETVPREKEWMILVALSRVRSVEGCRAVAKWTKCRAGKWLASAVGLDDELEVSMVIDAWSRLPRILSNNISNFDSEVWRRHGIESCLQRCRDLKCEIFFNCIATKCKLLGWTRDLVYVWWTLGAHSDADADLFKSIRGTIVLEAVAEALLLYACSNIEHINLLDIVFSHNKEHPVVRNFLCTKVAVGRPANVCKEPLVAALCFRLCKLCDCLADAAMAAAAVWREVDFVQTATQERRNFVTLLLYYALRAINPLPDRLQVMVLPGISNEMESNSQDDRFNAMLVAEAFATALKQELHFDDLPEKHRQYAHSFLVLAGIEEKAHFTICNAKEPKSDLEKSFSEKEKKLPIARRDGAKVIRRTPRARRGPDDAVELSGSESEDETVEKQADKEEYYDSSSSDSEELEPYDLNDDGIDLEPVQNPKYLRDLIALLQTKTDADNVFDNHEAALKTAEDLIRSRPADLRDQALPLIQALANLDNKFEIEHFHQRKSKAMIALAVAEPAIVVGRFLASECVMGDLAVSERDSMLRLMAAAAYELAGRTEERSNTEEESLLLDDGQRVRGKSTLVPGYKVSGKTRRWGFRRNKPQQSRPNKFGQIAARHFFFPLLYGYVSEQGDRIREDSTFKHYLAARILQTLSVFADAAQNTPSAPLLATHLIAFAWSNVSAPDAAVRRSALAACLTALSVVPEGAQLLEIHAGTLNLPPPDDLHAFALVATEADSDPQVRSLADTLARLCPPSAFNISLPSSSTIYSRRRASVLLPPRVAS
mmetsp:Transcript_6063/g.8961  ORF Transcript_6063/g.8961 Transcript_6063/m.8961 type:complete len:842 (-) Transcript_6063:2340-4865(-)|eukprot:CAMPEP_0197307644 /NCGR_PEP_ID=MMETSP0891-20130614/5503_1 /TAXON_ID=44058 ORGANISM="Aureoumbra lagunensis, Strain CCMP1510" /NCGR_SAMPLE_ID=MMETSP0891 /ASSEMBLY_ACC=CAM_ASM_000534 /LENGTH=841 /DNA_ID=CAMNT_0042791223 /DNA_START=431 /DNA_END=2956 /DNA_ORIENTATION=+